MYVQGVSIRKVSNVIEKKYVPYSKSFVSSLTKDLDEEVKLWRNSDISSIQYPYVIVYVVYIKVRKNNKVVSKACHIAIGINEKGNREIIGLDLSDKKTNIHGQTSLGIYNLEDDYLDLKISKSNKIDIRKGCHMAKMSGSFSKKHLIKSTKEKYRGI